MRSSRPWPPRRAGSGSSRSPPGRWSARATTPTRARARRWRLPPERPDRPDRPTCGSLIPLKDSLTSGPLPRVTIALIVLNVLVLGWQLTLSGTAASSPELAAEHVSKRDQAAIELGAIPFRLTHPGSACGIGSEGVVCGADGLVEAGGTVGTEIPDNLDQAPWWLTPLTSIFLHVDALHVALNVLFLWIFGGAVEALVGGGRFLALYLIAACAAAYAQGFVDQPSCLVGV
ncbi:MAG: rhomboid family intramembrane serine protease [Acidobacteria bacterium]|nr:MAG: rhomboid family intramembrane serine protease [Acidobacteriota bacterium]